MIMQSPYEERAGELLKEKKKELRSLKKEILTETVSQIKKIIVLIIQD